MTAIVGSNIKLEVTPEVLEYCKEALTFVNPDYVKKERLGYSTYNTPQLIKMYIIATHDGIRYAYLPFGTLNDFWSYIKDDYVSLLKDNPIEVKGSVPLYDYQKIAVEKALIAQNGVLVSRAGSGKTQMAIELIRRLSKKTLWLTHTKDLLTQSKSRAEQYLTNCTFGTITEGHVDIGDITFATIQTMSKLNLDRYKDMFSVIIVDECHRVAGSPDKMTMFYHVLDNLAARYKYGITATAHRSDGLIRCMFAIIGDIFYEVPESAIADKTLKAKIRYKNTRWVLKHDADIYNYDGTLNFAEFMNQICFDDQRNLQIATDIKAHKGESCLVLSDRLTQLRDLKERVGYGVMIDGKMTSKKAKEAREKAIEDMRTGKETVLFASYNLAKEGLDIPRLTRLFFASPKKDEAVIIQSVGRIERAIEGKDEAIVFDYIDNFDICKAMLYSRQKIYRKNGNVN